MADKTQYVEIYVRLRTRDENGNDLHLPFEINKSIEVDQHRPGLDFDLAENTALAATIPTGAISDSIATPAVVLISSDREILIDPNNQDAAFANCPKAKLMLVANWDADDVGADTRFDNFDAKNPAAASTGANDANLTVWSSGHN